MSWSDWHKTTNQSPQSLIHSFRMRKNVIQVRERWWGHKKGKWILKWYEYTFKTESEAQWIYKRMKRANFPQSLLWNLTLEIKPKIEKVPVPKERRK